MATKTEPFTSGSYDTGFFENQETSGINLQFINNQVEVGFTSGTYETGGVVTINTLDMSEPGSASIDITKISSNGSVWIYICLTKTTTTNPHDEADWYRFGRIAGTYYAQKKVAGSKSTIASGAAGTLTLNYKIDLPATGNDVRFIEGVSELASEATYSLSSRDCYIYAVAELDSGTHEGDFDNFVIEYTAAGGGRIMGSLAGQGGLAGKGGLAGIGGGLAG